MRVKAPEEISVKIYELRDPRDLTCSPRYVGITSNSLEIRYKGHLNKTGLSVDSYSSRWIKKLIKEGVKPIIHLIEEVIGWDYACKVEQYWIKEFKEQGYKLVNSTEGGEGTVGRKFKEHELEKCRLNNSGSKNNMYGKFGKNNPNFGRKASKESINKQLITMTKILKDRGQIRDKGITKSNTSPTWIARASLDGKILNLGNFLEKEYAVKARQLFIEKKYNEENFTIEKAREFVLSLREEYNAIKKYKKKVNRSPEVSYLEHNNKWRARTIENGKEKYLGCFTTEEEAIEVWKEMINKLKKPSYKNFTNI